MEDDFKKFSSLIKGVYQTIENEAKKPKKVDPLACPSVHKVLSCSENYRQVN